MCGRFGLSDIEQMERRFGVELTEGLAFEPTYNAAPGQTLPVIVPVASGRTLALMRWGLVPRWARDEKIGYKLINARSETAAEKPSFRAALRERRCLVPANWFYEWKGDRGAKIPHVIRRRDGGLFAMAASFAPSSPFAAIASARFCSAHNPAVLRPLIASPIFSPPLTVRC